MGLLAVDTLHLFPETHSVAAAVQAKYGKVAAVFKPAGLATQAEFIARHGFAESLNHGDFDLHSKVEPYNRGLAALGRDVLITGRRVDQGEKRVVLDVWEAQPRILNPMSAWLWPDVTAFCDAEGVPVNPAHNYVFRAPKSIPATERHLPDAPWVKADLGKPFWRASEAELLGSPPAPKASTYVFKSFGDTHTSVPVLPHESERAGRFVRSGAKTECGIHTRAARPGAPHGGKLVDLRASSAAAGGALLARASASLELTERQACDVELLVNGGFSPLTGFMTKTEYESVLAHGRLPEQQLWALPITLDTSDAAAAKVGAVVALRYKGVPVAALEVSSSWTPNRVAEAHAVFGSANAEHPGVLDLLTERGKWYVGGRVTGLAPLARSIACASPAEVRSKLPPGASVVAFQCRNPIHKAHFELVRRSLEEVKDCVVLVHPTVGPTQPDDIPGDVRVETYKALAAELANPRLVWEFLPFNMRMAGPREAIQHMIIR
jgi:3'-phosphoadenosine 5'-phosphosulfate sulfotransferase (PAPS reductase)/FAD synthetase